MSPGKHKRLNLKEIIACLLEEKKQLDTVIASLEALEKPPLSAEDDPQTPPRRGRRFMSGEERQRVSERMKKYWLARGASDDGGATT